MLNGRPFEFTDWTCGLLGQLSPRQPDGFNCGVFVLIVARCLHHGVKITRRWQRQQLDEQRNLITLELMDAKLRSFVG